MFSKLINTRSLGSWFVKGTEESTLGKDSLVPRMAYDESDLFSKETQNSFFGFKNSTLDFLKETHLNYVAVTYQAKPFFNPSIRSPFFSTVFLEFCVRY